MSTDGQYLREDLKLNVESLVDVDVVVEEK